MSRRTVYTGKYYPARGGYQSYSGEDDYEPAGLESTSVHRIYRLSLSYSMEIDAVNCEIQTQK
jgi:hypothetical protein